MANMNRRSIELFHSLQRSHGFFGKAFSFNWTHLRFLVFDQLQEHLTDLLCQKFTLNIAFESPENRAAMLEITFLMQNFDLGIAVMRSRLF